MDYPEALALTQPAKGQSSSRLPLWVRTCIDVGYVTALGRYSPDSTHPDASYFTSVLGEPGSTPNLYSDAFWLLCSESVCDEFPGVDRYVARIREGLEVYRTLDADDADTVVDWSAERILYSGDGRIVEDAGVARVMTLDMLKDIVNPSSWVTPYELFGAEGQLARCMLACTNNRRRWFLLQLWIIVAYRLSGNPAVDDVESIFTELWAFEPSFDACHMMGGMFKSYRKLVTTHIRLEGLWVTALNKVGIARKEHWGVCAYDFPLCGAHCDMCHEALGVPRNCHEEGQYVIEDRCRDGFVGLDLTDTPRNGSRVEGVSVAEYIVEQHVELPGDFVLSSPCDDADWDFV